MNLARIFQILLLLLVAVLNEHISSGATRRYTYRSTSYRSTSYRRTSYTNGTGTTPIWVPIVAVAVIFLTIGGIIIGVCICYHSKKKNRSIQPHKRPVVNGVGPNARQGYNMHGYNNGMGQGPNNMQGYNNGVGPNPAAPPLPAIYGTGANPAYPPNAPPPAYATTQNPAYPF